MPAFRVGYFVGRKGILRARFSSDAPPRFEAFSWDSISSAASEPDSVVSVAFCPGVRVDRAPKGIFVPRPGSLGHIEDPETLRDFVKSLTGQPTVQCLTTSSEAVAAVFGEGNFSAGGERVEVWRDGDGKLQGRSTPADGPDDAGVLTWRSIEIPIPFVVAFAAAMCDPDLVPNRAASLPGSRRALLDRLRDPLLNVAAAAALLLGGFALWFHREKAREEADLKVVRRATVDLWRRLLPSDEPKESGLPRALQRRLGEAGGEDHVPSMLAFWTEIGTRLPDPEPLGLEVESLDLSPEGGRLGARVPAAKDDPLKNAAALEGHLNQSVKLRARGDYEVRDGHVQVRLRMEYKP